jgi:predicted RecA/RadA family phage recombinase
MRNFVQPGRVVTIIAPTGGVTAGAVVIVGAIVGIASTTQPAGAEVEVATEGVFDLAKVTADALPAGAVAKVVTSSGLIGVAGTASIGWVLLTAAAGTSVVRVRLCPAVAGTPTVMEAEPEHEQHRGGRKAA